MKNELVSIVIPCYNAENYLDKCLTALLNQTYSNLEVIIINDGSTDSSEKIINSYIKKFEKKRMKLILINQENGGQASAVNNGLKYVTGDYLMWQDADDWYELDAVENLHNYLKDNNLNLVRGESVNRLDDNNNTIISYGRSESPLDYNIFDKYIFETDSYCFPGIWMVNMKFFDSRIKNRSIYTSRSGQNWQLILPISYNEKCGYLNKIVYNYRIVNNSHYHSVKKISKLLKRCNEHKEILYNVLDSIDIISNNEMKKYKIKIKLKYLKKKIKIILIYIKQFLKRRQNDKKYN